MQDNSTQIMHDLIALNQFNFILILKIYHENWKFIKNPNFQKPNFQKF